MNGFVAAANPGGRRALGYYDGGTLNYYYWLANTFALGDRYFASVPGPTYPNRMFLLSGWSHNHTKNEPLRGVDAEESLFHQLTVTPRSCGCCRRVSACPRSRAATPTTSRSTISSTSANRGFRRCPKPPNRRSPPANGRVAG
jgi:hypothetical protein